MISLLFAIFAISCTEKEPVVEFQFDVFAEDGSDISGTQTVNFSKTITLTYKAQSLASLNVETPEGWNSEVKMSAKNIVISAPKAEDQTAELSGKVTMIAKSLNNDEKVVTVDVAAVEAGIEFAVAGVEEDVKFRFADTKKCALESANVSEVEVTAPKGWTVSANVAANELTVVSPDRSDETAELEGTVMPTRHRQQQHCLRQSNQLYFQI